MVPWSSISHMEEYKYSYLLIGKAYWYWTSTYSQIIIKTMLRYLSQIYRPAFVPIFLILGFNQEANEGCCYWSCWANLLFASVQNRPWRYVGTWSTCHSPPHRYSTSSKSFNRCRHVTWWLCFPPPSWNRLHWRLKSWYF